METLGFLDVVQRSSRESVADVVRVSCRVFALHVL